MPSASAQVIAPDPSPGARKPGSNGVAVGRKLEMVIHRPMASLTGCADDAS